MLGAAFTRRPVWLSVLMGAGFRNELRDTPLPSTGA